MKNLKTTLLLSIALIVLTLNFTTYHEVKTEIRTTKDLQSVYPFRIKSLVFKDGLKARCRENSKYWFFNDNKEQQIILTYSKNIFGFSSVNAI